MNQSNCLTFNLYSAGTRTSFHTLLKQSASFGKFMVTMGGRKGGLGLTSGLSLTYYLFSHIFCLLICQLNANTTE